MSCYSNCLNEKYKGKYAYKSLIKVQNLWSWAFWAGARIQFLLHKSMCKKLTEKNLLWASAGKQPSHLHEASMRRQSGRKKYSWNGCWFNRANVWGAVICAFCCWIGTQNVCEKKKLLIKNNINTSLSDLTWLRCVFREGEVTAYHCHHNIISVRQPGSLNQQILQHVLQ